MPCSTEVRSVFAKPRLWKLCLEQMDGPGPQPSVFQIFEGKLTSTLEYRAFGVYSETWQMSPSGDLRAGRSCERS